jgi:hypothetical protein
MPVEGMADRTLGMAGRVASEALGALVEVLLPGLELEFDRDLANVEPTPFVEADRTKPAMRRKSVSHSLSSELNVADNSAPTPQ